MERQVTSLRSGYSTGACAAAAAKAAAEVLLGGDASPVVEVPFPDGTRVALATLYARMSGEDAEAAVRKDAGDDVDATHGAVVAASLSWAKDGDVTFVAGEGVGMVTKPGLSIPPGEPAVNPVPRGMIRAAIREVTKLPVRLVLSIPGGKALAEKTFNPRLGVVGGLSILGTTGRVRPFDLEALRDALKCALDVAAACGIRAPVLVPGHIGEKAARRHFRLSDPQVIEVVNEWVFVLDRIGEYRFDRLLVLGHPGKLAKLAMGHWDTHSARSPGAVSFVAALAETLLGRALPPCPTVEGVLGALPAPDRERVAAKLAGRVREAVVHRMGSGRDAAVALVDMRGDILGFEGELATWT